MKKQTEEEGIFRETARFVKYNLKFTFSVIFFITLLTFAIFGNKGLIQRLELESEKKELEKTLEDEKKKSQMIQKEIEDLKNSEKKIEEVAREKYGMTKDSEKIYKIIVDSLK